MHPSLLHQSFPPTLLVFTLPDFGALLLGLADENPEQTQTQTQGVPTATPTPTPTLHPDLHSSCLAMRNVAAHCKEGVAEKGQGFCFSPVLRHLLLLNKFTDLHWLPVMHRIKFKTLVLAYKAVKGSAPAYIRKLIRPYTPARPALTPTHPNHTCTSRSRLLSVLAPRWWNDLPVDVRTAETLTTF